MDGETGTLLWSEARHISSSAVRRKEKCQVSTIEVRGVNHRRIVLESRLRNEKHTYLRYRFKIHHCLQSHAAQHNGDWKQRIVQQQVDV